MSEPAACEATPAPPRALTELNETVRRSRLGGPFYVVLWLLSGLAANLWQRAPIAFVLIGLVFVGFVFARFRTRGLAEGASVAAVARRLNAVWALVLVNVAIWGAAACWLLVTAPDESARNVVAVSSYAFATAFAHNFCMRLQRTLVAVALLYLPTLSGFVVTGARYEFIVVGLMYLLYVVFAAVRGHREYGQRLDLEDELRLQRDLFQQQSQRDGLTGLANRRRFNALLDQWIAAPGPLALLILDLDHFKSVNDRHGHGMGDACLRALAERLEQSFADPEAVVARLGGEEFAVLARAAAAEACAARAERFRADWAAVPLVLDGTTLATTVSIGVGMRDAGRHPDGDALYRDVDAALYRAKAEGRNAVRQVEPVPG